MTTLQPDNGVCAALLFADFSTAAVEYHRNATVYSPGDPAGSVCYILHGAIKLTAHATDGEELVAAMLGPGDFFGEGAMAGYRSRVGTASAVTHTHILTVRQEDMRRLLHDRHELSDQFLASMLSRSAGLEADLVHELTAA